MQSEQHTQQEQLDELLRRAKEQVEGEDPSNTEEDANTLGEDYIRPEQDDEEDYYEDEDPSEDEYDEYDSDDEYAEDTEDYPNDEEEELDEEQEGEDSPQAALGERLKQKKLIGNEGIDEQWRYAKQIPRHRWLFLAYLLVLMCLSAYWNTHYNSTLREVSIREKVLENLRYRSLFMTAELVRIERINSIEERIKELNLPLEHSTQPPYQIVDTLQTK